MMIVVAAKEVCELMAISAAIAGLLIESYKYLNKQEIITLCYYPLCYQD